MKPRIKLDYVIPGEGRVWVCEGAGLKRHSFSPSVAYRQWRDDYDAKCKRALDEQVVRIGLIHDEVWAKFRGAGISRV